MIGISKLYCGESFTHDPLRYGEKVSDSRAAKHSHTIQKNANDRRPIVVWNITRACNLKCIHCYTDSDNRKYSGELTTEQGKKLIDDLAEFKIPALLMSGGEPFMRSDFFELAEYAVKKGLRLVISSNGTLINEKNAAKISGIGITYIGISLDGIGAVNDSFRRVAGTFEKTKNAVRLCIKNGIKISLRITLTKHNLLDIKNIFKFAEDENIDRICFYHLAYSGRGEKISDEDLSKNETREAIDIILNYARYFKEKKIV